MIAPVASLLGLPRASGYGRKPSLVLVNGLAEQAETWYRNIRAWRRHFSLYAPNIAVYDGPALQQRIAQRQPIDIDYLVGQLRTYLESFVQAPPYFLVANSMGGKVAVEYAVRYPEQVARLVLLCPSGLGDEEQIPIVEGVRHNDMRAIVGSVFYNIRRLDREVVRYFQQRFVERRWRLGLVRTIRGTMDHCVRDLLPRLEQPTLLVVGQEDRIVDPEHAATVCAAVAARRIRLPRPLRTRPADRKGQDRQPAGGGLPESADGGVANPDWRAGGVSPPVMARSHSPGGLRPPLAKSAPGLVVLEDTADLDLQARPLVMHDGGVPRIHRHDRLQRDGVVHDDVEGMFGAVRVWGKRLLMDAGGEAPARIAELRQDQPVAPVEFRPARDGNPGWVRGVGGNGPHARAFRVILKAPVADVPDGSVGILGSNPPRRLLDRCLLGAGLKQIDAVNQHSDQGAIGRDAIDHPPGRRRSTRQRRQPARQEREHNTNTHQASDGWERR